MKKPVTSTNCEMRNTKRTSSGRPVHDVTKLVIHLPNLLDLITIPSFFLWVDNCFLLFFPSDLLAYLQ